MAANPAAAPAQLIPLKTAPLATGEQYVMFPSLTLAMGGVGVAVRDPISDPFRNPARAMWLRGSLAFAGPTVYDIAEEGAEAGAGVTLSAGVLLRSARWFGGGAFALQQLDDPGRSGFSPVANDTRLIDEPAGNRYGQAFLGFVLPGGRTAIGVSAFRAELGLVDGMHHLYSSGSGIDQDGGIMDWRIGLVHELGERRWFEAVVVHDRIDIRHDVTYVTQRWFHPLQTMLPNISTHVRRVSNLDRTRTTGFHLGYVWPLSSPGDRAGLAFTVNRKLHPKIPEYDLNVPRDPGNSTAFSMAVGWAHEEEASTFGLDFVLQPAFSHTWSEAAAATTSNSGDVIPAGGRTIDNRLRFTNFLFAMGSEKRWGAGAIQFGFSAQLYMYKLDQQDRVRLIDRESTESWLEWSPTWGGTLRTGSIELRYSGRLVNKGFVPLFEEDRTFVTVPPAAPPGQDFLVVPGAPVRLPDFRTFTNQFSVTVPVG